MMKARRDTGIKALGSVPWGSRIWVFYDTRQDLFDTILAFVKAGLENNEFCSIITQSEAITKKTLGDTFPGLFQYMEKGSVEFIAHDKIRINNKLIDIPEAYTHAKTLLREAEGKGLNGIRTAIDLSGFNKGDWQDFIDNRPKLDELLSEEHFLKICTYPLYKCQANEFVNVLKQYKYVLINRRGNYNLEKKARLHHTGKEIKHSQGNYHSVIHSLKKAAKISESKLLESIRYSEYVSGLSTLKEGRFIEISENFSRFFGYTREEVIGRTSLELKIWPDDKSREAMVKSLKKQGMILKGKAGMRVKSGETISVTYSNDLITVGDVPCIIWFYIDAMKRRRARENLRLVKQGNTKGLLRTIQRRFINAGLQSCSDEEVIELLLGITLPESLASKLASESISEFHSLSKFLESPVDRWESLGIPYKTALSLLLIQEVPERVLKQKVMAQPTYNSPQQIVDYLYYSLRNAKKEVLKVIHLNNQGQIEDIMDLFEGSVDRISFNLREAIENAIARKAKSLVFIHNHPTGDPTPSKTDKQLTRDLVFIGNILQIRVLDHIIVGDNRYFSFADEGLIEEYETDFLNLKLSVTHEAKYRLEQARTFANVHRVLTRKSTPVFLKLQ